MSEEKTVREFWIRTKVFSNDGYAFGNPEAAKHEINVPIIHVIEHSAYLAVKQELDAARAEINYLNRMLADERSGDCDKDKKIRLQTQQFADAKAQIADYEAALESCELYPNGMTNMKVKETLNKWRAK